MMTLPSLLTGRCLPKKELVIYSKLLLTSTLLNALPLGSIKPEIYRWHKSLLLLQVWPALMLDSIDILSLDQ